MNSHDFFLAWLMKRLRFIFTITVWLCRLNGRCWLENGGSGDFYNEMLPWKESRISLADLNDSVFKQSQSQIGWQLSLNSEANYNSLTQFYRESVLRALANHDYRWISNNFPRVSYANFLTQIHRRLYGSRPNQVQRVVFENPSLRLSLIRLWFPYSIR